MNKSALINTIQGSVSSIKSLFSKSVEETLSPSGSLGIDIGSSSIKVVRLEVSKETFKVLSFAVEKIQDKNYREALSRALAKAKVAAGGFAVISVSGQGTISRYVELPLMNKSELESSMKFEIEKYVPFPLAEVATTYTVVEEMRDKAKMTILIAAAKNDLVQKKCALMNGVNVNVRVVDLDCLALANFATQVIFAKEKKYCVCVIQMGRTVCHINILVDGVPQLSRDIFIGGDDITKKISEALDLSYPEAEKLKNTPGTRQGEVLHIAEAVLNSLAEEIRISLDYFEARTNRAVDKIFMCGGLSRLAGLGDFLNHILSVDVKVLDFTDKLILDSSLNQEEFKENSDLLPVALGLALR